MKKFLFYFLLLSSLSVFGQLSKRMAQDTLIWQSDAPLSKEHFKAKRSSQGNVPAYIASALYLYQKENNGQLMFYVEAIMLKSKSFMKDESAYTLNHEQMHFNICELYARKLRQRIAEKDFTKIRDVVGEITRLYKKALMEWQKEEENYDKDTQHGINAAKQEVWNKKITEELELLEAFASTEVNIVK